MWLGWGKGVVSLVEHLLLGEHMRVNPGFSGGITGFRRGRRSAVRQVEKIAGRALALIPGPANSGRQRAAQVPLPLVGTLPTMRQAEEIMNSRASVHSARVPHPSPSRSEVS